MDSGNIFNPAMERMGREQLKKLQLEKLIGTVRRCYDNTPFYHNKMNEMGVKPDDIRSLEDIRRLPMTQKTDLRDNYPFGLFAEPMQNIVRIHASSGTTGNPTTVGYTKNDIKIWSECTARALGCAGGKANDVIQIAYGYGLFTGGLGIHYGAEYLGATAVPISSGNTVRQIKLMQDYQTNLLCCTPSYALLLGETMSEMGVDFSKLKLRAGCFGAEPWTENMRTRIEELLHIDALDIYGLSETMGPGVAMECKEAKHGLHVWEDYFLIEILDPSTKEPLPDGEVGELAITTLDKEGMPTLRYLTHDLTSIIAEPCICGRTHRRIARLRGRTDDMLIIRGVNVFPSQIEGVLAKMKGVMPHYIIIVDRVNNLDTIEIKVELTPDIFSDEVRKIEAIRNELTHSIRDVLNLTAKITLVPPKSIERSEGKSKHVIDKRNL